jgi:hypothetical protein
MPSAASLGALTPAQWLRDEYLRGKERAYLMKKNSGKQAVINSSASILAAAFRISAAAPA